MYAHLYSPSCTHVPIIEITILVCRHLASYDSLPKYSEILVIRYAKTDPKYARASTDTYKHALNGIVLHLKQAIEVYHWGQDTMNCYCQWNIMEQQAQLMTIQCRLSLDRSPRKDHIGQCFPWKSMVEGQPLCSVCIRVPTLVTCWMLRKGLAKFWLEGVINHHKHLQCMHMHILFFHAIW
jgi:hypothetical protein